MEKNIVLHDKLIILLLVALRLLKKKKSTVKIGDGSATEYNCGVKAEK